MACIEIEYLGGQAVPALGLTDAEILDAVEGGLVAAGRGQTVIEPRMHLRPAAGPDGDQVDGHFNVLRGHVAPLGLAGVKLVGDFQGNYRHGLPSEIGLLALFDPATGTPRAVIDADWRSCLKGADIQVEASRLPEPTPVRRGTLVIPYGTMSALPLDFTDRFDAFVMDDLGQLDAGPFGALRPHINAGRIGRESFYAEIGEIAAAVKPGRQSADQTILFWHRGLATSDIALGAFMLEKARRMGLVIRLPYA
jgi:ornithine cyclodeaminase/alanine dehydrogenase-like protein (mu-crystallin family)